MADLKQRSENEKPTIEEKSHGGDALESDYLASFLAKAKRTPDTFTEYDAYYHIMSNILAGGEATGISLSAATYYLCNNPQALAKLRQEMKDLKARSQNRIIGTKEASECPYLQAVIKEAIRLFPAPGLGVNRVVPEGGLEVAGWTFPEGVGPPFKVLLDGLSTTYNHGLTTYQTLIGTNPWVAGVNPVAFGPDPTNFRPERWLESPQSASKLNDYFFGVSLSSFRHPLFSSSTYVFSTG